MSEDASFKGIAGADVVDVGEGVGNLAVESVLDVGAYIVIVLELLRVVLEGG